MTLIRSPTFWLVLIAAAVIGFGIVIWFWRRAEPGFKDYVKNAELWHELVDEQQAIAESAAAAAGWDDEQVAAVVRRFVFDAKSSREASDDAQLLQTLGTRTHFALLQILSDPSLRSRLVKPTGENLGPEAPFNRLCDLLDEAPAETVPLLAPFLNDLSDDIRKDAALVIASTGADTLVAPIRTALGDSDEYVRSYALMGLERAIDGNRLSDICRRELFNDVQRLLLNDDGRDEAAGILLDFDQQRAKEFFLSDAMFRSDSKSLHHVLHALNARGLTVPRDRLLNLIEKLHQQELKYPKTYLLGEALQSLGMHQVAQDRVTFDQFVSHSERIVAEGAASAMLASHGLVGFRERLWETASKQGLDAVTTPQRLYIAVLSMDGEVNNGGFSQYFFNSSGDEWQAALAGLEAMKSNERLGILREAIAKFGPAMPSRERAERMQQLAKLARLNESGFDDLENRYYTSKEVLEVLATHYVLKNADAFR